jgi:hypothetical protein
MADRTSIYTKKGYLFSLNWTILRILHNFMNIRFRIIVPNLQLNCMSSAAVCCTLPSRNTKCFGAFRPVTNTMRIKNSPTLSRVTFLNWKGTGEKILWTDRRAACSPQTACWSPLNYQRQILGNKLSVNFARIWMTFVFASRPVSGYCNYNLHWNIRVLRCLALLCDVHENAQILKRRLSVVFTYGFFNISENSSEFVAFTLG